MELVSLIQQIMHCEHLTNIRNLAQGEIRSQYLDSSKARTMLGWQPNYTLETGIAETVEWYRNFMGVRQTK